MGGFTGGTSSNNNSAGDNYQKAIEKTYGSKKKSTSNRETYRTSKSYQSSVSGSKGRKAKEEARKAVSKSKLDNYQIGKSNTGIKTLDIVLDATQKGRQKTFEVNRDYYKKNVVGKPGYEDTFEGYEKYIKGRSTGNLDAMGRTINKGDKGGGIEIANTAGSTAKQTQQAAVDAAPDGPTNVEMPTEESEAERLLKIKRKGRRATILNVPDDELTLSKKVLLG